MAVQHEIKSQLAKLLATEDLVVEHKQVETASFNVETRVLILPLWEKASNSVYDMLVGHEVGHALFTPNDDWFLKTDVPHGIVNVCEDARIEKLMKRRYMGLAKTFYYGYSELNDDDFFNLEEEDLDSFNLADRINLYFKIGNFLDLHFTEREIEIRELVGQSETFDEVLAAAKVLHEYCKENKRIKRKSQILTHINYQWVECLINLILRSLMKKVKRKKIVNQHKVHHHQKLRRVKDQIRVVI